MLQVTMTRTGFSVYTGAVLALDPLVIDADPSTGIAHLTEENCSWPNFSIRRGMAPDANTIGGSAQLAATIGQGSIALGLIAHGDDMTETFASMEELAAATSQFTYDLTLEVGGVDIGTFPAFAELPLWGALDSGNVRAALNEATIVIPLNPRTA